jgi:spore coat protein CotF
MQTVQVQLEDNIYQDMLQSGIDIQGELKKMIKKTIYHKEYKMANEINQGISEIRNGKTRPIEDLFNEL